MERFRARLVAVSVTVGSIIAACQYTAPDNPSDGPAGDGPPILPDAGPCTEAGKACVTDGSGTVLETCSGEGAQPIVEACPWGCLSTNGAHCGLLQPSGGAVMASDLEPVEGQTLLPITISSASTVAINTSTGEISGGIRAAGSGVNSGIEFTVRGTVGIFRFQSLTITSEVAIVGPNAVALVALEGMSIDDLINVRGDCDGTSAGPGGFVGGSGNQDGNGPATGEGSGARGSGADDNASGGGGGGYAGSGGSGGGGTSTPVTAGGTIYGNAEITVLRGGGGGGGGGAGGGTGGGGGGAIQLAANGTIAFDDGGKINAGGCGGGVGGDKNGGGGGGAGGAILIEAFAVTFTSDSVLAANGGGGGGADTPPDATDGQDGKPSGSQASGGGGGPKGGAGGDGGANVVLGGEVGVTDPNNGGGGGGGVGWIRINTFTGLALIDVPTISPDPAENGPASQGVARVE